MPDGFLNLCKPRGPTSHDVVASVRRVLGIRRVGHAGTLDPLAEGVLPIAIGRATRLIDFLAATDKEYYAEAELGVQTTTDDAEGEVIMTTSVPPFSATEVDAALERFRGEIEQVPPRYSAVKIGGRRAYELARRGGEVTAAPRRVTIYHIERRIWTPPVLGFTVRCSRGTYIRALARDLGAYLGVGASLRRLVRIRVGPFHLEEAASVEEIQREPAAYLLAPDIALLSLPALGLSAAELEHVRHGRSWYSAEPTAPLARAYTPEGYLAGLISGEGQRWQPRLVLVE